MQINIKLPPVIWTHRHWRLVLLTDPFPFVRPFFRSFILPSVWPELFSKSGHKIFPKLKKDYGHNLTKLDFLEKNLARQKILENQSIKIELFWESGTTIQILFIFGQEVQNSHTEKTECVFFFNFRRYTSSSITLVVVSPDEKFAETVKINFLLTWPFSTK